MAATRNIVGQTFQMNDRPHTVVGVLPPIPQYPADCDVYMPTSACPFRAAAERRIAEQRRAFGALQVFGRLKPGVPLAEAAASVATVADRFRRDHPDVYRDGQGFQATAVDLLGELTRNARPMLLVLIGATLLVLLIACANVASLSMARALARERELSLRTALGASRWQIGGQLLAESVLLSLAGGAVGLVVAWSTIDALTTFAGRFTSRIHDVSLDQGVLGFALGLSLLTGVIFGAFPALTSRPAPAGALKQAGAGGQGPRRRRLQQGAGGRAGGRVGRAAGGRRLAAVQPPSSAERPDGLSSRARAVGRGVRQLLALPDAPTISCGSTSRSSSACRTSRA